MSKPLFIKADEVAKDLEVSKPYAYKLIKMLNDDLKKEGFITISGRVSRVYYNEKLYGIKSKEVGEE